MIKSSGVLFCSTYSSQRKHIPTCTCICICTSSLHSDSVLGISDMTKNDYSIINTVVN